MEPANVLHITSLGDGWSDKDQVMLHACFQLLEDFLDKEQPWTVVERIFGKEYAESFGPRPISDERKELEELYDWWQTRKHLDPFEGDVSAIFDEDDRQLLRLIRRRLTLWC